MPKAEFGTPKWLSNRMKSKGLQRLRWFCQMCEKQCRDENGFKCHCMSESHRRQMQIFAQRPGKYISEFSRQFEASFMRLMRTRYSRARVLANKVYCELISDKQHVHMNSTTWTTLSEFIWYLKRSGKVEVEYSDEGWYIQCVDRGRVDLNEQAEIKRREEYSAEQCRARIMNQRIKEAWEKAADKSEKQVKSVDKDKLKETQIKLAVKSEEENPTKKLKTPTFFSAIDDDDNGADDNENYTSLVENQSDQNRKLTALEQLYYERERRKQRLMSKQKRLQRNLSPSLDRTVDMTDVESEVESNFDEDDEIPWVEPNLIVKVDCEDIFDGKYHGLKGRIIEVKEEFLADVEMLKSKEVVLLDQTMLEQVLPVRDGCVKILFGKHKGQVGKVLIVDIDNEIMQVKLNSGVNSEFPFSVLCKYISSE